MKISRHFTTAGRDVFETVAYEKRTSRIANSDGSVVFEMTDAEIPKAWSQLATDIMVSKYFRKAGVPQYDAEGRPALDDGGKVVTGPERSARQVIHRLAGCWRHWGETHGYFDSAEDAQAFYDELCHMLLHQMAAPNSPQWFNTGLNWAYGITGPAQGHFYCDPDTGELKKSANAYEHPQPHACQPYAAPISTPQGPIAIGDIVTRKLTGLEVYDGTADGAGTTRVVAVKANGEKPVLRVVLKHGGHVEATADHLVWSVAAGRGGGEWVRLDSLRPGSRMLEVRDLGEPEAADGRGGTAVAVKPRRLLQPVDRIELVGTQPVYDIQTESGQYLCGNVLVHNCFIQAVDDDLVNPGGLMELWTREARLFKYGSGTGTNFSKVRGEDERLSGGGKSSGLMSFLKIGDRAAGAIKSGGTTRRAAKMVCLDLDHPDIEAFVNWKVREEIKVACLAEGIRRLPADQREIAERLNLKLDYDFNGEAYATVSGQNSNNSVRIPNSFFEAVESDGDWTLTNRVGGDVAKTVKARDLWDQIAFAAWRCADPGVQYDTTINQWHTCPASGRINASNPCVTGDTRVLTPGGIWRRIDQMIHLPSRVVTNVDAQEIHVTEGAFPTGTREVFELTTEAGYGVKLTADHKVWTANRGWTEARDLTIGDELKLPAKPACVLEVGEPQDARLFHLVGLLLSDANGDATSIDLDAALADADGADGYADYIARHWDRPRAESAAEDDRFDGGVGGVGGVATMVSAPAARTMTFSDRRMVSRLRAFVKVGRDGSARLSDDAFTAGLAAQKHLLRGLFTADGVVTADSVELRSESAGLLADVQLVLLGFGVKSRRAGGVLRVEPSTLHAFARHVQLLPGRKLDVLAELISRSGPQAGESLDRFASLTPLGTQQVFDLTEPATSSFVANGLTVHNCSEYMFLDDTACNLASLNVLKFYDAATGRFDADAYRHAVRVWTVVLEISVLMASFPSEEIARKSYRFRTLGLGYANLGAMLMQAGLPYDSDAGRAVCAALTSVLTGESYATSAELAGELGAFPGYRENREPMLRVIRNHRRAAYDCQNHLPECDLGDYEGLDLLPVGIDAGEFGDGHPLLPDALLASARDCWDRAYTLGQRHGFRNAQTTVIAPTGTIGLLMDCDTTGVEPDFALVKFKKLAGGGYFKIANQSLRPALSNLKYSESQISDVMKHVLGSLSLHGAPHVNYESLKSKGFTDAELEKITKSLPAQFELSFAFSPWALGDETMQRLGVTDEIKSTAGFSLLRHLGYTKRQIDEANDVICGRATVEGAPHLKAEHLPVFDCANKCGKHGTRYIAAAGHIRMMAAAQPFISGAISKTINLPNEATVEEIKESYRLSWQLGLKANALYRDGSKLSQPLNVKSDADAEEASEADDESNVEAGRLEVVANVGDALQTIANPKSQIDNDAEPRVIERIVERVVNRPMRRRLPDTRRALTHKFDVAGHEGYLTVGLYPDGQPGEVFITMAKEGSTIGGLMDTIATLVSVSLQYGVPVESLVRKFEHVRFEPNGMTRNRDIPFAKSLTDYIFRYLAMEFVPGYRAANAPKRDGDAAPPLVAEHLSPQPPASPAETEKSTNGHGPRLEPDTAKPFQYAAPTPPDAPSPASSPSRRLAALATAPSFAGAAGDPLNQQGSEMQSDAPACDVCGSITVRSGTCYKCLNCGNSMGCS